LASVVVAAAAMVVVPDGGTVVVERRVPTCRESFVEKRGARGV